MLQIRWDLEALMRTIKGAALEAGAKEVASRLSNFRCPIHGEAPTVRVKGRSESELRLSVEGCCAELERQVKEALG